MMLSLSLSLVGDLKCRNVRLDINNTIIFDSQHEKLNIHRPGQHRWRSTVFITITGGNQF